MSYYKVINGFKYDKQLWEVATQFTTGEGDQHISLREMQLIVKLAQDGRGITEIEKATLRYIRNHFNLTKAATEWFDNQFNIIPETDPISSIKKVGTAEFDLPNLSILASEEEVMAQSTLSNNVISFENVLRATLTSILKDGKDVESPRSLVENVHELFRDRFDTDEAWDAALTAKVREYLKENSQLALHPLRPLTDDENLFNRPEGGETTDLNWIFQLSLHNLSDHIYWIITDRTGVKVTYNYGFN